MDGGNDVGSGVSSSSVSMAEVQRLSILLEAAEVTPEDKRSNYVCEGNKFGASRSLASTLAGDCKFAVDSSCIRAGFVEW